MPTDYSKTAIDLTNPNEVKNNLLDWQRARKVIEAHKTALNKSEEYKALLAAEAEAKKSYDKLEESVRRAGSYQDIAEGHYALLQKVQSTTYSVAAIKKVIPDFASNIITEAVNEKALLGLLRGGLIAQGQVDECAITKLLTPRLIIKVVE